MIKFLVLSFFCLISIKTFALQSSSSFYIEIRNEKISVESPSEKDLKSLAGLQKDPSTFKVGLVFNNKTFDKIYAELKNEGETIRRFVLTPEQNKTIEIEAKYIGKLYFVPISPPFQGVPLKFAQGKYEIPKTTKEK